MIKVKLTNRLGQALPVLVKDLDSPKNLRQISIPRRRSKLIREEELSAHCQDLYKRGYLTITRTGKPDKPQSEKAETVRTMETKDEPVKVAKKPAPRRKATRKSSKSRKKGRK